MALQATAIQRIHDGLKLLRISGPDVVEDFRGASPSSGFVQAPERPREIFDIENCRGAALVIRALECGQELSVINLLDSFKA